MLGGVVVAWLTRVWHVAVFAAGAWSFRCVSLSSRRLPRNIMEWLPLELWRASSLAQETRTCEAAYERLTKSGNTSQLSALRRSIEGRIDDLEAFFIDNLEDERAVLFEKQVRRWVAGPLAASMQCCRRYR